MAYILRDELHSMPTKDATNTWALALDFRSCSLVT